MLSPIGMPVSDGPVPVTGLTTFDPYLEPTIATNGGLYGGAPWCPIDPQGNILCICET